MAERSNESIIMADLTSNWDLKELKKSQIALAQTLMKVIFDRIEQMEEEDLIVPNIEKGKSSETMLLTQDEILNDIIDQAHNRALIA